MAKNKCALNLKHWCTKIELFITLINLQTITLFMVKLKIIDLHKKYMNYYSKRFALINRQRWTVKFKQRISGEDFLTPLHIRTKYESTNYIIISTKMTYNL